MVTTTCARCGRGVESGQYLCAQCRDEESVPVSSAPPRAPRAGDLEQRAGRWPGWMPKPSPVQYHATLAVTILLVLAGLGVFAFLSQRGVGPFTGRVDRFTLAQDGPVLYVEVSVKNEGSKTARANCALAPRYGGHVGEPRTAFLTPEIDPGSSVSLRRAVRGVEANPTSVRITCN